jgi:hypothetical protein
MPSTGNFGGQKVAESSQSSLLAKSFTSCLNRQISPLGWWIPSEKAPDEADMCVLLFAELWRVKNCFAVEETSLRSQANAVPIASTA